MAKSREPYPLEYRQLIVELVRAGRSPVRGMLTIFRQWRTAGQQTRRTRSLAGPLAAVSDSTKGMAPEGTRQRLYPRSPVHSKHDAFSPTKSFTMLAGAMQ